ncbi:hypothetical protein DL96DRAFT_1628317 [Flagelloscypha sp. PMI_526]|nr:hypothetical protein DL96DRAFT_1628317 [Flagelloscypha sp. PMI_526]
MNLAEFNEAVITINIVHAATLTLFYYDYMLTLPDEIRYYWKAPGGSGFYLFACHRYYNLLASFFLAYRPYAWMSIPAAICANIRTAYQVSLILAEVMVAVLLTLRTYALYGKSKMVLGLFGSVLATGLAICGWAIVKQKVSHTSNLPDFGGCPYPLEYESEIFFAAPWLTLLVFDLLVFGLTVWKSYYSTRIRGQLLSIPIVKLIMRDGAIYSGVMVSANLANIVTYYVPGRFQGAQGCLSILSWSLSVTMMSRLLLNLRANDRDLRRSEELSTGMTWASSPREQTGDTGGVFTTNLDMELNRLEQRTNLPVDVVSR